MFVVDALIKILGAIWDRLPEKQRRPMLFTVGVLATLAGAFFLGLSPVGDVVKDLIRPEPEIPFIAIDKPEPEAEVSSPFTIGGSIASQTKIETLWIVVKPKAPVPEFQGLVFPQGQPDITGTPLGGVAEWEFPLSITNEKMGREITVMVLLADETLHAEFIRYRDDVKTGRRNLGYLPSVNLNPRDKIKVVIDFD